MIKKITQSNNTSVDRPFVQKATDFAYFRLRKAIHTCRLLLPSTKPGEFNGVLVGFEKQRLAEQFLPFESPAIKPEFKAENIEQIRRHVNPDETVVVIGGGRGITAAVAAHQVGESGHIHVYEPDQQRVTTITDTLHLNDFEDRCTVTQAAVGPVHRLGDTIDLNRDSTFPVLSPSKLPRCDVIEFDCEGAELLIFESLNEPPAETVIVEVHHHKEFAPYDDASLLIDALQQLGYHTERYGDQPKVIVGVLEGEVS